MKTKVIIPDHYFVGTTQFPPGEVCGNCESRGDSGCGRDAYATCKDYTKATHWYKTIRGEGEVIGITSEGLYIVYLRAPFYTDQHGEQQAMVVHGSELMGMDGQKLVEV